MKLTIEMVSNGWLLTDESDSEMPKRHVFEDAGSDSIINPSKDTMQAFSRLLWAVNDLIGPTTSRYSKHRLHISLKKGDKYEPQ